MKENLGPPRLVRKAETPVYLGIPPMAQRIFTGIAVDDQLAPVTTRTTSLDAARTFFDLDMVRPEGSNS
ncbi:MAG: hypothetical protein A3I07_00400 [Candidatus Doudnabacteria bacterium RIFCSPLOWO2_02_FULL_42_9]|uniref:Uncharacterized protein n=1 Tax=Candidatus Doudnabacteria bacterium RIFCSPHIGHO2_01_FULL_41_86 TaxID=1817821 RepID=A0A1F5N9M5_9BACT|nr:MAG: hypothetical protein A2717_02590 [Candidatus Doudnabacteria bacterium RIFCSPHIGHO2_01_FULL_41_86]OGE75483.1 MAG: hypothetical protein A3K07_00920 [Candidatus Doudnabacteria bacterium RIFCSPHIGHO2_01_43_10]OGE85440.1 MAG: hypothetical protein A3E28_02160 [Candidatus Doudnabacteria bacterium RIFCSPHIGHO2_12_FULL_42_22]OGE86978.1 MAG: hypothetical protein A3C49_02995 [Candidatus Doudnabacteria bacterium RIFCSPHIGHO2_02_FULL_42_25]OGE92577.1 MAG: hypothetical protein A2895_03150 [Candidatus